jgi:hypothetical protein
VAGHALFPARGYLPPSVTPVVVGGVIRKAVGAVLGGQAVEFGVKHVVAPQQVSRPQS